MLLLLVVVVATFSNSLSNVFQFDDGISFISSASTVSPFAIKQIFAGGSGRPIGFYSFILGDLAHGDWLPGFHIINIGLHAIASIGVFLLTERLISLTEFRKKFSKEQLWFIPLAASLLFAVHPLQTQPVNYIIQRVTILAGLFYIYSTYFFIRVNQSKSKVQKLLWGSLLVFSSLAAFLSKENTFSLPAALVSVYLLFFWKKISIKEFIQEKTSLFLVFLGVLASGIWLVILKWPTIVFHTTNQRTPIGEYLTPTNYLMTQAVVITQYFRLTLLPINLSLDHYVPLVHSVLEPRFIIGFVLIAALLKLAHSVRKTQPLISFAIMWIFIALSVESSFMPIKDVMFEHRMYLPLVGVSLLFGLGMSTLFVRIKNGLTLRLILLSAIIGALSFISYQRNIVWSSEVLMWQDVVNKYPQLPRAHFNLGLKLAEQEGKVPEAFVQFQHAIDLYPDHSKAHNAIGYLYLLSKDYEDSLFHLGLAVELEPGNQLYRQNYDEAFIEYARNKNDDSL